MNKQKKKDKNRLFSLSTAGIVIGVGFLAYVMSLFGFFQLLEFKLYDLTFQIRGPNQFQITPDSTEIVVVAIDQETADSLSFPFDRKHYATAITKLSQLGARRIVFDIDFSSVGANPESDSLFYKAIEKAGNVVLAAKIIDRHARGIKDAIRDVKPPSTSIAPPGTQFGLVNDLVDMDGVTRRYPLFFTARGKAYLTLSTKTLALERDAMDEKLDSVQIGFFKFAGMKAPLFDQNSTLLNYFGPAATFSTYSFLHIVQGDYDFDFSEEEIALLKEFDPEGYEEMFTSPFKDKIVFIGASSEDLQDNKYTPFFKAAEPLKTPGVEVHANALQMMLQGSFIRPLGLLWTLIFIVILSFVMFLNGRDLSKIFGLVVCSIFILEIAGLGAFTIYAGNSQGWIVMLIAAVLGLFVFMGKGKNASQWAGLFVTFLLVEIIIASGVRLFEQELWIRQIPLLLTVVLGYPTNLVYRFVLAQKEKAMIRGMFAQYVPQKVTDELISNPEKATLGGEQRRLSVLFTDVAGFTTVSEAMTPHQLVLLLNEYLTAMTNIILENDGIVDKYEGDLIMAEFGAPIWYEDHAAKCCRASLRMQAKLKQMRVKWREEGQVPLYSRVGVNSGEMIVGNMGSEQVFDYTVMGDAVNLSSRLEGANKSYDTTIMIGHETWKDVHDVFITRPLDLLRVKGKTEPVRVYELIAECDADLTDDMRKTIELYEKGLGHYREGRFKAAKDYFEKAIEITENDGPSKTYLKRCDMYIATPPPENWDGVWELTEK